MPRALMEIVGEIEEEIEEEIKSIIKVIIKYIIKSIIKIKIETVIIQRMLGKDGIEIKFGIRQECR
jgi:hypothetical protein